VCSQGRKVDLGFCVSYTAHIVFKKILMKVETKDLEKSQKELTIAIPQADFDKYMDKAAAKISQGLKIEGFRPGNAPRQMVEKHVGADRIFEEAVQIAVPETLIAALEQEKIEAIGQPEVTPQKIAVGNDFVYKAKVAVLPKFELPDYSKIKVARKPVKVADKEFDDVLNDLRKSRATSVKVNRAAKEGDRLEVSFEVKIDGKVIKGGKSENHPVVIGEKKFVPGFEEKLIGMKADEEKEFDLDFPKDYYQKKLAGKPAHFTVKVKTVQEVKTPELNDEFAKSVGEFKDLEALQKQIRHNLEHEKAHKEENRVEMAIAEEIAKKAEIEIPDVLVKAEQEKMVKELEQNLAQQGLKFEDYLKSINKKREDLVADQKDAAVKRVKVSLILREVGKKEKIEITEDELKSELEKVKKSFGQMYPASAQGATAGKKGQEGMLAQFDTPQYKDHLRAMMINRKIFKRLKELCATGEEHKC